MGAASLEQAAAVPDRIAGSDRWLTSVAVSQRMFPGPEGVHTVFLANGEAYPDALVAGAPGAAYGYPILLTERDAIPGPVQTELDRLDPATIIIVGGPAAVSTELEEQARRNWGAVTRLGGANRFATAALVSKWAFNEELPAAFLASGADFPDALAGGVAGARADGPVLLTRPDELSPEAAAHLADLRPERIVVLGGPTAVSEAVLTAAARIAPVTRLAGSDRFATSAAISEATFADASTVFVANGTTFPDALAGTPLAAASGAPILLVTQSAVSPSVCAELGRLSPDRVVALGGSAAVSDAALALASGCAGPLTPLPKPGPTETIGPPPVTAGG